MQLLGASSSSTEERVEHIEHFILDHGVLRRWGSNLLEAAKVFIGRSLTSLRRLLSVRLLLHRYVGRQRMRFGEHICRCRQNRAVVNGLFTLSHGNDLVHRHLRDLAGRWAVQR